MGKTIKKNDWRSKQYVKYQVSRAEVLMYMKLYNVSYDVAKKYLETEANKTRHCDNRHSGMLYSFNDKHTKKG